MRRPTDVLSIWGTQPRLLKPIYDPDHHYRVVVVVVLIYIPGPYCLGIVIQ